MINAFTVDSIKKMDFIIFKRMIFDILSDKTPPEISFFKVITNLAINVLTNENEYIRPKDINGKSGGLVSLKDSNDIVILPDLHARRTFFIDVLLWNIPDRCPPDANPPDANPPDTYLFELLENSKITVLCIGDGVHGEGHFSRRWIKAFDEFTKDFEERVFMDKEIADSFNLMLAIMCLKIRYPNNFHFLKGNHENITNETGNGNYSFAKYANEGAMVVEYFQRFYDMELLDLYSQFEKNLPLFVVARNFLASHAEPQFFFERDRIINYRNDGELIESLTWTENFSSIRGTTDKLLNYFLEGSDNEHTYYFSGHRPINHNYFKINNDRFVQIHNPAKEIALFIDQTKDIDLNTAVKIVPKNNFINK